MIAGLFLFAVGTFMSLQARLGLSPWDVLHDGLRLQTPLSFGVATISVGAALVILGLAVGVRPGPGTIANMVLIGVFVDLLLATGIGDGLNRSGLVLRALVLVAGIIVVGLGSALYIGAGLGAGPRDGVMLAVATRTRARIGVARACVEGSALLMGIALGGRVGIGTVLFAVGIGPSVDLWFTVFRMDSSGHARKR
ncbi:MAG: hypothetical protein H0U16_12895 [Actinobacteria bacterium]|nr:hypothetical protein [Actinomycetota bacterium]